MSRRRRNEAEALIRLLGEDKITEMIEAAQRGVEEIGEKTEEASQYTKQLKGAWKSNIVVLDAALSIGERLGSAIGGALETLKNAASARAVDKAFTAQFANASAQLEKLRESVRGALSDRELKAVATQFDRANVSIDQTAQVLDVAARISATTGTALGEVVEELQDAIIGASDSNLEKFGIIVDLPELAMSYASAQGIAKDEIDKSVESAAILNEILTEVSKKFEGADLSGLNTQVGALEAQMKNLSDKTEFYTAAVLLGIAEDLGVIKRSGATASTVVTQFFDVLEDGKVSIDQVGIGLGQAAAASAKFEVINGKTVQTVKNSNEQLTEADRLFEKVKDQITSSDEAYRIYEQRIRGLAEQRMGPFTEALYGAEAAASILNAEIFELNERFGVAQLAIDRKTAALKRNAVAQYEAAKAAAKASDEAWEKEKERYVEQELARLKREYEAFVREEKLLQRLSELSERRGQKPPPGSTPDPDDADEVIPDPYTHDVKGFTGPTMEAAFGSDRGPPQALIDRVMTAREEVDRLGNSFSALGQSFQNQFIEGIRSGVNTLTGEIDRMKSLFKAAETAGKSTAEAVAIAAPGAIQAGAEIAKGLGASIEVTETLYGLSDVAQAATKFAYGDFVSGSLFTVSAGLHFAAAGAAASAKGGGSPSGGRSAPRAPAPTASGGPATGGGGRGPITVTQVFSGVMVGPGGTREAGRALRTMTEQEAARGSRSPDFIPAG